MKVLAASGRAVLVLAACLSSIRPLPAQTAKPDQPGEWPSPGRDPGLTRWSPLDQITARNVAELRVAWSFSTGVPGPAAGSPLVVGSMMYLLTPWPNQVIALDLGAPGAPERWRWKAPLPPRLPASYPSDSSAASRGLGYHESGKLYVPILSGELAALEARTGREIWRVRNSDWRTGALLPGPPLVAGNLVVVGTGGSAPGAPGYLTVYDALNGRLVWRGWTTGPDSLVRLDGPANPAYPSHQDRDLGVRSWPGAEWQRGGGTPSGWLSFDPDLNLVYAGTGPPAPPNPAGRPGDNKWSSSLMARDLATGRVRWILQLTPHDQWGFGAASENILADLTIGGAPVRALVHFDPNGFVYTLNRATGRLLLAERFGPLNWASSIDLSAARPAIEPRFAAPRGARSTEGVCPAAIGMKGPAPAAYAPPAHLFFVPVNNFCMDLMVLPGGRDLGIALKTGPGGIPGRFIAWNAEQTALKWEIREAVPVTGGALATAGGLVFYGTLDGWLKAVDQSSGRELWKYQTRAGILGSPIAFLGPDGKEYIAVLSGAGGADGSPAVLTVFGR
jgi:PQQ-dependent dehydrogenase (methanol/ethanol family)